MKRLTVLAVLLSAYLSGQNLVVNPSFESDPEPPIRFWPTANVPGSPVVQGWVNPTRGTADYFNSKYSFIDNAPILLARSGEGRAAVICGLGKQLPDSRNYKEYVQGVFNEKMEAGKTYKVSFWCALDRTSSFTAPEIGAYISSEPVRENTKDRLRVKPQIRVKKPIVAENGWVKVEGTYTATGGEEWITIGSFSDTAVIALKPFNPYEYTFGVSEHVRRNAYVYIDDVCVAPYEKGKPCDCDELQIGSGKQHYLFLVDRSESMGEDGKLSTLKNEIAAFADKFNAHDRVSLITFSNGPELRLPFSRYHGKKDVQHSMKRMRPKGGTNGDAAIQFAVHYLDTIITREGIGNYHLIIATDGMFVLSKKTREEAQRVLSEKGCSVDVLHYGSSENKSLMELSTVYANSSYQMAKPEMTATFFNSEVIQTETESQKKVLQYTNMKEAYKYEYKPRQD
jgi:Mg-chelatase subunit ChlD